MNRRELLRELSRVQATWVNRSTPGAGDVNVTAEQEQDYLTRIAAVFDRAREDVRRKRKRSAQAMAAQRVIAELMARFDKSRALADLDGGAVTAADAFRFDPSQPRDEDGRWTSGAPGAGGSLLSLWESQDGDASKVTRDDLMRLGGAIADIAHRDGVDLGDHAAFYRVVNEATQAEGGTINGRQYIRAMDRDFGTNVEHQLLDALEGRDVRPDEAVRKMPEPEPEAPIDDPSVVRPDFGASYAERARNLAASINSGVAEMQELAGGTVARTHMMSWNNGTRSVLKTATGNWGTLTPKDQTDAEEISGHIADALGVRAPVTQRVSEGEIYLEYMPGQTALKAFPHGADLPPDLVNSDDAIRMGAMDYLTANIDRHRGNWTMDADGRIYAIDHGMAFANPGMPESYGPFAVAHFGPDRSNPLTSADVERLRARLDGLRPEFDRLGVPEWFADMQTRFADIERNASGSRDVLA